MKKCQILPAIDMIDGQCVRLVQGDYDQKTVFAADPVAKAKEFSALGADSIHLVDLDGAKDGTTANFETIRSIVQATGLAVEVGGGIRTMDVIDAYLSAGIDRVILGTAAVTDEDFLAAAVARYGAKIAVGADVKDGYIAIKGWLEKSAVTLEDFLSKMQEIGVKHIICTDISKDGAMNGTNRELYRQLSQRFSLDITASGGVSSIEDVEKLNRLGIYGAIIGKAYYTGAIDLAEAISYTKSL